MSDEFNLSSARFDEVVLQSDKPVLVDFWAEWCGPCKVMSPIVEELAKEVDGVLIRKVNVDEAGDVAQRFNILSIPTFIIFKGGQPVDQFSGSMTKEQLRAKVEVHV
jgi:thioredoxin 1